MKNLLIVLCVMSAAAVNTSFSKTENDKAISLTVKYSFKGVEEGYDHDTRTVLYIDDQLAAVSSVKKESQLNAVMASITPGRHNIRVVNQALYKGNWEDHTVRNDYSIDCTYRAEVNLKNSLAIELLFDLNNQTSRVR